MGDFVALYDYFTGRDAELKAIADHISQNKRMVLLQGIGGAGKTATAYHYALQNHQQYD